MSTRCTRCNRPLTDPESVARGMGPVCARKSGFTGQKTSREMRDFHDARVEEDITLSGGLILRREPRDEKMDLVKTNVPHLVVHHSPSGFEFGYGGSGPADLALNVVHFFVQQMDLGEADSTVECFEGEVSQLAWNLHQPFKQEIIAQLDEEGGHVGAWKIRKWIDQAAQGDPGVVGDLTNQMPQAK